MNAQYRNRRKRTAQVDVPLFAARHKWNEVPGSQENADAATGRLAPTRYHPGGRRYSVGLCAVVVSLVACENPQPPAPCGPLPAQTVVTGATTTVKACFEDPNGDALEYAATTSDPAVATASASDNVVTVGGVSLGTAQVTVTATDAGGLKADERFQVLVPNQTPVAVGAIPEFQVAAGDSTAVDVSSHFSDPDGQELSYAAALSDTGVATVSVAGAVITVAGRAKGTATVTVAATDPGGLTATRGFVVTVPNRAPETTGLIPHETVEVGDTVTHELADYFIDPDGDMLVYAATAFDTALVRIQVSGSTVTVAAVAKGEAAATVTATDTEGLTATQAFTVTVPNRAPLAVSEIPADTIAVGETATFDPSNYFSDPDGDDLAYTASVTDSALVMASVSGGLVAIEAVAKGQAMVTVTATDTEGLTATQALTITVPNRAPLAVGKIPADTLRVGESRTLELIAYFSDPDGDALACEASVSDSALAAASVSGSRVSVTAISKGRATVTVTATDTEGLTATQELIVTVPNRAPLAVGAVPADTIAAGDTVTVDPSGYFSDPDGDDLAYAAAASDSGVVTAMVSGSAMMVAAVGKGRSTVTVTATDTEGLTAMQTFTVMVPNRVPQAVGVVPATTVSVGETTTLDPSAYFRDPDGDDLAYGAMVSDSTVVTASASATGAITLAGIARGDGTVTITATDTEGLEATQPFVVTVPNRAPHAVGEMGAGTMAAGQTTTLDLLSYFSDPDGDALSHVVSVSDSAVVAASVSGSVVSVTAIAKGGARVTLTATDPEGLAATQVFTVTVPNRAPLAVGVIPAATVPAGEARHLDPSAYFSDPDGDVLVYGATLSDSAVITAAVSGGAVSVVGVAKGRAKVTVTATDPEGSAARQAFVATIPNQPPLAVDSIEALTIEHGDTAFFDLFGYFSDPDGDDLRFDASSSASSVIGLILTGSPMTISPVAKGEAEVTVTATDPEGLAVAQGFTVSVPNRAPLAVGAFPALRMTKGGIRRVSPESGFTDPDDDELVFEAVSSDLEVVRVWVSRRDVLVRAVAKGSATVTITARDPEELTTTGDFEVRVKASGGSDPNRPPKAVGSIVDQNLEEGDSLTYGAASYFSDPDGDELEFAAGSSDDGVAEVEVSGDDVTVRAVSGGAAKITITARDPGGLTADPEFSVTVSEASDSNRAPVVVGKLSAQELEEGDSLTYGAASYFSDPDGDELEFAAGSSDDGVAEVEVSGDDVTVRAVSGGAAKITITARDPGGLTADPEFSVTVSEASDSNRAPVVVGKLSAQELEEGDSLTYGAASYFSDPDGDELEFAAGSSDDGVAEVEVSGDDVTVRAVSGGAAKITITARDPGGLTADPEFSVTVSEASDSNRAPVVVGKLSAQELEEGDSLTYGAASYFSDPDGDELEFAAGSSDDGVAEVEVSGDDVTVRAVSGGAAKITITARDPGGLTADPEFSVTVSEASDSNRAPVVVGKLSAQELEEGDSLTYGAASYFSDPDGDELEFAAGSSDDGVAEVEVSGDDVTVRAVSGGAAKITITARDPGGLTADPEFSVTVSEASDSNRAPVVVGKLSAQELEEGDSLTYGAASYFSDPDGDELEFAAGSSDDGVAEVEVSGDDVTVRAVSGGAAKITITARDPGGLTADPEFSVTVSEASDSNRAPVVVGKLSAQELEEGDSLTYGAASYFSDPDGDELEFAAGSSDDGVAEVEVSGDDVTVRAVSGGAAKITITARDPGGLTADPEFSVTVSEASDSNRAPVVVGKLSAQELEEGDSLTYGAASYFSDPDGDELEFAAGSSDDGVAEVEVSGDDVTVRAVSGGAAKITITARDPGGLTADPEFSVTVSEASDSNRAPVVVGKLSAQELEEGDSLTYGAASYFSDPDGDELEFAAGSSDDGVAEVEVSGDDVTVRAVSGGAAKITITARDPGGLTADPEFSVTVSEASDSNRAPVVVGKLSAQELEEGDSLTYGAASYFSDPDGDELEFAAGSSDDGVAEVEVSGDDVTVRAVSGGAAKITITARDPGGLTADPEFSVTVSEASDSNRAPVVVGKLSAQELEEGDSLTYGAASYFSDPDGDTLEFAAASANLDVATAEVSGSDLTVDAVAEGATTVSVIAEDPKGLADTMHFAVAVEAAVADGVHLQPDIGRAESDPPLDRGEQLRNGEDFPPVFDHVSGPSQFRNRLTEDR